jgi:hypothetical protein
MSTEALRAALEALSNEDMSPAQAWELKQRAMALLDAALAQRADEPVAPLNLVEALKSCAVLFDNIASYEDGHRYTATLGAKGARAAIAAAPAAPAYVPLSDEAIWQAYREKAMQGAEGILINFARAIESLVVARMKGTT